MELTLPVFPEQNYFVPRMDLRRYVRKAVNLRIILADKGGLASGEVIDLMTRGCGLRLLLIFRMRAVPHPQALPWR